MRYYFSYDGDVVQEVRIAYGGIAPIPTRISALEAILKGQPLSGIDHGRIKVELDSIINPISDVRASANYRLQMAETMLIDRLALEQKRLPDMNVRDPDSKLKSSGDIKKTN